MMLRKEIGLETDDGVLKIYMLGMSHLSQKVLSYLRTGAGIWKLGIQLQHHVGFLGNPLLVLIGW